MVRYHKASSHSKSFQSKTSRALFKMFPKLSVCYMGDVKCCCGHYGILYMDLRWKSTAYYVVHRKEEGHGWTNHNSKYKSACYIGNKFKLGQVA